jgi:pyrroloquinoline-quinone synthase
MVSKAWPVDGRGRGVPARADDAWSEQEFHDRLIETVVRAGLPLRTRYGFPKLDQEQGRLYHATFMKYFSFFAWRFPSWLLAVASRCPYQDVRRTIIEDCVDEEVADVDAGGRCHIDVLYDEAEACGMAREEIVNAEPSPTLLACLHALENLATSYSWEIGFAAMAGLEMGSSRPAVELRNKIFATEFTPEQVEQAATSRDSRPLSERTGVPPEQLVFAALHAYKDQFHGGGELALLLKYGTTRETQELILWAAKSSIDIFCVMRAEIDRLVRTAVGLPTAVVAA